MLQPYVERSDNLDEEPAQFNVLFFWDLVSENILFPRKFSSELNSSHLQCAAELGLYIFTPGEDSIQALERQLHEYKDLFPDFPFRTDQICHDVDVGDAAPLKQLP